MTLQLDVSKLKDTRSSLQKAKTRATEELWKRGKFLELLLDSTQQEMVHNFESSDSVFYVWLCSRRIGKSVASLSLAVRHCLATPGARVLYLSSTTENVKEIVDISAQTVLESCPEELKPEYKIKDVKFVFKNGSEIRIKGLDTVGADAIRGVKGDLVILDEFCFMKNLNYLISSIIMPMVIETGGRILMPSTPPKTPGHESIEWIQKAEERGSLTVKTIYDCPRFTPKQIALFEAEAGGASTSTFRREYLCKIEVDRETAILPALTEERLERLVQDCDNPGYMPDHYVSLDIGFRDLSVALFGWWDYDKACLVIQDEVVLKGRDATTDNVARHVADKEYELWRGIQPHKRVCDTDPRLIEDLRKLHNMQFRPTRKDNKEAQVNALNVMIIRDQLKVSPRCKTLLMHMKYGLWNEARTGFARTAALHHCDALDALLYMARNVDKGNVPTKEITRAWDKVWMGSKPTSVTSHGAAAMRSVFKRR